MMRYDGTRYSGIDFANLNEINNCTLESIHINLKYDIADMNVNKTSYYVTTINKVRMQLRLVEEEIAERILLDQWTNNITDSIKK